MRKCTDMYAKEPGVGIVECISKIWSIEGERMTPGSKMVPMSR